MDSDKRTLVEGQRTKTPSPFLQHVAGTEHLGLPREASKVLGALVYSPIMFPFAFPWIHGTVFLTPYYVTNSYGMCPVHVQQSDIKKKQM